MNRAARAALALLLAVSATAASQDDTPPPWMESRLDVAYGERLALRDMDGDGRLEVVRVGPDGVAVFVLDDAGRISEGPAHELSWPTPRVGWDLLDFDGDGATEVVLYLDGERVSLWRPAAGADLEDVLTDLAGLLPVGIRRIQFARDVDDDGRVDLIIPATGRFLIHVQADDGFTGSPLEIGYQADIRHRMGDPSRLDAEFEQRVSIPLFRLDDIDGDGRPDLVSETDDDLAVYLARPGLPPEPDWTLDLGALRAELDQPQGIDFEDLTRMIPPDIGWVTADLDGEAPLDLVLQRGSRITTYLDGSHGPDLERPDQVLKASGNVLHFLVRDIDGDGLDDLQLLRVESVSLGTVLRWLVISGALDFDVFTYRNEGGALARKPTTRKSLALGHPGILDFADEAEEFGEELGRRFEWQARAADLTGSGRPGDVVDADERRVRFHRGGVPEDWVSFEDRIRDKDVQQLLEELFIFALDDMPDGSRKLFEIDKLDEFIPMPGWSLHLAVQEREPFAVWKATEHWNVDEVRVRDIDGDGRDDTILVLEDGTTDAHAAVFLMTR